MPLWLRLFSLGFCVPFLAAAAGCASYTSAYEPPADGRARVLWDDTEVVMGISGTNDGCLAAVSSEAAAPTYRYRGSGGVTVGFWVPVPIVHVHHHHSAPGHGGAARTAANPRMVAPSGGRASGGGSGSKGDAPKEAYVALAVAMIIASPVIAYGLALGRAEPEEEVAETIDRVNAYNDLARWPGTPCSFPGTP